MRQVLLIACLVTSSSCALVHHLDDYTTADPVVGGSTQGVTPPTTDGTPPDAGAPAPQCQVNADCANLPTGLAGTVALEVGVANPMVCVRATSTCQPLLTPDCPRVYGEVTNDDAVLLGTILGGDDDGALENAARLAGEEISAYTRPIAIVACEASGDVLRATQHLVDDLHVPAIVGPTLAEDVIDATQQVTAKGGTVLMTPTSVASQITSLADGDLTWRALPSDNQRAKLVIEQINELETVLKSTRSATVVKLGIVHRTDALGMSAHDAISGTLIINGRFINDPANAANVSDDPYAPGDTAAEAAIVTNYASTFKPDMVFITAPEQIADVVVPLEQALTAARAVNKPYYMLTDASKSQALLDAIGAATLPADIKRRIRGVGVMPEALSMPVLDAFSAAYSAHFGATPPMSAAESYDSMYAVAFAIAATTDMGLSGASVAHGLRLLGVGDPATVGASSLGAAMQSLLAGKSLSLRGTAGLLQWNTSGDLGAGTVEVWCVGSAAGRPAFGSSGVTMDIATQVVGGAFVQCQ